MGVEKERKFLVKGNKVPAFVKNNVKSKKIVQGYLMLSGKEQLRVRVIDNQRAYICYKKGISKTEKLEFEYEIPVVDALELLKQCSIKVKKTRWSYTDVYRNTIDMDYYPGINVIVVEVEYRGEKLLDNHIPVFCSGEITGQSLFSNMNLGILQSIGKD